MQSTETVTDFSYTTRKSKLRRVWPELGQQRQVQRHIREGPAVARSLVKDLATRRLEKEVHELRYRLLRSHDLAKYNNENKRLEEKGIVIISHDHL